MGVLGLDDERLEAGLPGHDARGINNRRPGRRFAYPRGALLGLGHIDPTEVVVELHPALGDRQHRRAVGCNVDLEDGAFGRGDSSGGPDLELLPAGEYGQDLPGEHLPAGGLLGLIEDDLGAWAQGDTLAGGGDDLYGAVGARLDAVTNAGGDAAALHCQPRPLPAALNLHGPSRGLQVEGRARRPESGLERHQRQAGQDHPDQASCR